jgi:hypothetical protein
MTFPATLAAMEEAGYRRNNYSRCKGCLAPIEWWTTPTRSRIPMEPMPLPDSLAVSHWARCPHEKDFRRPAPCSQQDDSQPLLPLSTPPQLTVNKPENKGSNERKPR